MYRIIPKRKIWLGLSGLLVALSITALSLWGLNFGIDFTGGSLLEVKFTEGAPSVTKIQDSLDELSISSLIVQPTEDNHVILRFQDTSQETHREILNKLDSINKTENSLQELRFDSVGPSIGEELKRKSVNAAFIVLLVIIVYIALVFKKVSKPVSSWKYGLVAIVALFHDLLITLGIFSLLGYLYNVEINTAFVAAILTVLGYSVNDTIVVFDRIRENLPQSEKGFAGTVNVSVNQTITRSINTSVTTLLVLLSVFFFGGETIKDFVLALMIGVGIGTYSSIFLASPLLVEWYKKQERNRA